jgi:hypothetical protein
MPLDPSISLQGRGVDIKTPDPLATLVSVAQLKNWQSQQQLRDLQMQELAATQQEYRGLQAPGGPLSQLRALRAPQPGMVSGDQLGALPPGGGAVAVTPGGGPPGDITQPPMAMPQGQGQGDVNALPVEGGQMGQPPPPADQPAQPAQPAQQAQPNLPPDMGSGARSAQRAQILEDMQLKYPRVAKHLITPMIALESHLLTQQKGQLDYQKTGMEMIEQSMATVLDQPKDAQPAAYGQYRQALIASGIPGANRLPAEFNPQQVATFATAARDKKTRVAQDLELLGKENDAWKNFNEQAKLGEGEYKQDASGFHFFLPKYPGANTGLLGGRGSTGGPGAPVTNPVTGQPIRGMEAQQRQIEQEQTLNAAFEKETEPYKNARTAYNQIQAARTSDPKNQLASDTALLNGFQALLQHTGGHMKPEEINSWSDQLQKMAQRISTNQVLDDPQREAIRSQSDKLYRGAEQTYEQQLKTHRERASGFTNVRPGMTAPDIRANARPYTMKDIQTAVQQANADGTRHMTEQQMEQYFQHQGRTRGD